MSENTRKLFVIDTNVLLYDKASIHSFPGNDVIIPIAPAVYGHGMGNGIRSKSNDITPMDTPAVNDINHTSNEPSLNGVNSNSDKSLERM